jgi:RecB family exonuclease
LWLRANGRALVATELEFDTAVGRARLRGRVDRLERDAAGRGVVVDLKTGSSKARDDEVARHAQLAAYQVAVEHGGFAGHDVDAAGGAELVQVGAGAFAERPRVQAQPPLTEADDPSWAADLIRTVADGMAGSAFLAIANAHCDRCPVRASCPARDEGRVVTA